MTGLLIVAGMAVATWLMWLWADAPNKNRRDCANTEHEASGPWCRTCLFVPVSIAGLECDWCKTRERTS